MDYIKIAILNINIKYIERSFFPSMYPLLKKYNKEQPLSCPYLRDIANYICNCCR